MADVNSNSSSDLAAEGSITPEHQREGGEPTPEAGTTMDPGDQTDTDSAEYAKLLAAKDLGPFASYNLAKSKEADGDLAGAQAQYSDLLAKYPDHFLTPEAHYSLARTQELAGAKDAAKATYEKIILLYPDTSWAQQAKDKLTPPAQKAQAAQPQPAKK